MTRRSHPQHDAQLRILIAQGAARLMAEGGISDIASARRKAADQHGAGHSRNLPGNEEIEAALQEYQRLFQPRQQPQQLQALRQTAIKAMSLFQPFKPRLVGRVLNGTADEQSAIELHLFAHSAEELRLFLLEHNIPCEQGERRVHFKAGAPKHFPLFSFIAGETAIELTLFPIDGERQLPLNPLDGKPMPRARLAQVEALLAQDG